MNIFKALFGGRSSQAEEKKEEKNFEVLKYDGVRALKMQQFGYAVQCFLHALELNSTDLECRDYLSQAYIAMGDMEKAYEQLQSISTACPDNVAVLTRLADVAYMMEDYAAMADACAKAIEVDEEDPQALYLYAKAYRGLGDVPNAVAMLTKALDKYDDFEAARLLRGETLLANGDVEEAGKDADELLKRIEGNEDVLMLNARVAKAKGDMEKAEQTYDAVLDVNPFSVDAFAERAEVRRQLGNEAGAAEDEASAKELRASQQQPCEDVGEKVKDRMKSMDPYKIFNNE